MDEYLRHQDSGSPSERRDVAGVSGWPESSQIEICCRDVADALRRQDELVNSPAFSEAGFNESWQSCDARLKRAVVALVETPASNLSEFSQKLDLYTAWTETVEIEDALAARLSLSLVLECHRLLRTPTPSEVHSNQLRRAPFLSPSTTGRLNFPFSELFAGSRRNGSRRSQA